MLQDLTPTRVSARGAAVALMLAFALVGLAPLRIVPASSPSAASRPRLSDATAESFPESGTASFAASAASTIRDRSERESSKGSFQAEDRESDPEVGAEVEEDDVDLDGEVEVESPDRDDADQWSDENDAAGERKPEAREGKVRSRARGYAYGYDDESGERFGYVVVEPGVRWVTGSGDMVDFEEANRFRKEIRHEYLWARVGDERYVIDDPGILRRVREALEPQQRLGEEQSRLGAVQSRIGKRQSELGARQAAIGAEQAKIGAQQARLSRRIADREDRRESAYDFHRQMDQLANEMRRLSDQQEALSRRMEPLSQQQNELGGRMGEMGQKMGDLTRESARRIRSLVQEAIRSGAARRIR